MREGKCPNAVQPKSFRGLHKHSSQGLSSSNQDYAPTRYFLEPRFVQNAVMLNFTLQQESLNNISVQFKSRSYGLPDRAFA